MRNAKIYFAILLFIAGIFVAGQLYPAYFAEAQTLPPSSIAASGPPAVSAWLLNRSGITGFNGITAAVQQVRYSNNYVYVNSSDIPYYSIGPWQANPNTPTNQGYLFKIPRNPVAQTGTHTPTGLGAIGFWIDGVAIFNALDGFSYNNQNIWHQDAVVNEAISFDSCKGHPAPGGAYHHHQNPKCVFGINPASHSPLIGYAYDGFPVYGAYAFANSNGTGGIKRMTSSYRLRSISERTTLPNGTVLTAAQYGPTVATKALGTYVEDYEFVSGLGDLDEYNGRFSITPEYPNGTYAYFVTIYADGSSAYPYYIGPTYYGVVATENVTSRGHVTVTEPVTTYVPAAKIADFDGDGKTDISISRVTGANREWWLNSSTNGATTAAQFGLATDQITPGDFTGDGKNDVAVWRPSSGTWFVLRSENSTFFSFPFGASGDVPAPADYDGDGKTDSAVFRPSVATWYVQRTSDNGTTIATFGSPTDKPVPADYDGDGKVDIAIWRPGVGEWWYSKSSNGQVGALQFGVSTDRPVPGDFTGDGKADIAFFRPSTGFWYVLRSEDSSFFSFPFGTSGDTAAPGDYDGDGKFDAAVFRSSTATWYLNQSTAGVGIVNFGIGTDQPVPAAYVQ